MPKADAQGALSIMPEADAQGALSMKKQFETLWPDGYAPEGYRFARKTSLLASFIGLQQEKLKSLSRCDKKILDIPFLMIKLESKKANVLYRQLISFYQHRQLAGG